MAKNNSRDGRAPSQRQLRVAEMIRRTLSEVVARGDIHDPDLAHVSITVSEVRATPDLKVATAYVLPLGGVNAEAVIEALNRNKYELRRAVTKAMKLKHSPELKFLVDTSFDQMDSTKALLESAGVKRDLDRQDEAE